MKLKLSTPSKMKGTCKTWSTLAVTHCPASRVTALDVDKYDDLSIGDLVPACSNCYADKGFYHMPTVKAPRIHNASDWKRDTWVADMVETLTGHAHFRWFDSGDMFHIGLAEKIYQVMKQSPNTAFWLPTRMHKLDKFKPILAKMAKLSNVVVRKSSDSIEGKRIAGKNTSTIIASSLARSYSVGYTCPATIPGNKPNCKANDCTACWDKEVKVVAYVFH
jgi:hypothetical protein